MSSETEAGPSFEEWLEHAKQDMAPKMMESAYVIHLAPEEIDPKIALETGYAVLLNKPIIVVSMPGRTPSQGILRLAHAHIELKHALNTEEGVAELETKVGPLLRQEAGSD